MHQRAHLLWLENAIEVGDANERAFEDLAASATDVDKLKAIECELFFRDRPGRAD